MSIELTEADPKQLAADQRAELSPGKYKEIDAEAARAKGEARISASHGGGGATP